MQTKRMLIVDDDRNIQRMLRVCLEAPGYEIGQATDGAQALEAIDHQAPDVVLLDLAMPVLDGMSVLADLRTILSEQMTRVIVMTAHGSVRAAMQAVRLGAADFLEKPFKPDELRQSIAGTVYRREELLPQRSRRTQREEHGEDDLLILILSLPPRPPRSLR